MSAALRKELERYEELAEHRRRHPPTATMLGPSSALIGSPIASEAMHLLLGHRPLATHDRALVIDQRTRERSPAARDRAAARLADPPLSRPRLLPPRSAGTETGRGTRDSASRSSIRSPSSSTASTWSSSSYASPRACR